MKQVMDGLYHHYLDWLQNDNTHIEPLGIQKYSRSLKEIFDFFMK